MGAKLCLLAFGRYILQLFSGGLLCRNILRGDGWGLLYRLCTNATVLGALVLGFRCQTSCDVAVYDSMGSQPFLLCQRYSHRPHHSTNVHTVVAIRAQCRVVPIPQTRSVLRQHARADQDRFIRQQLLLPERRVRLAAHVDILPCHSHGFHFHHARSRAQKHVLQRV